MLSVLIPTYCYNALPLVETLHRQCLEIGIDFEILVFDDGSGSFPEAHAKINYLSGCSYRNLPKNIGRSKIRNLLARSASHDHLLFLDADVMPVSANFIREYCKWIDDQPKVVSGGLRYREERPGPDKMLRWTYGTLREAVRADVRREKPYERLLSSNFLIHRSIMQQVPFEENMPDLRREDTLFSYCLFQQHTLVMHIENPVYHEGLDSFDDAIRKEHQSLEGLHFMLKRNLLPPAYTRLSAAYDRLGVLRLRTFTGFLFRLFRKLMLRQLAGKKPSMLVFDLYRLGYLSTL